MASNIDKVVVKTIDGIKVVEFEETKPAVVKEKQLEEHQIEARLERINAQIAELQQEKADYESLLPNFAAAK